MTVGNGVKEGASPDVRSLKLGGHVGFDSLPDQLVNKSVQSGFSFNILCIGKDRILKGWRLASFIGEVDKLFSFYNDKRALFAEDCTYSITMMLFIVLL